MRDEAIHKNNTPAVARPGAGAAIVAGAVAAGLLASTPARAISPPLTFESSIPGTGDIKVLNYALALEDFESSLYQAALARLTALGIGTGDVVFNYATNFALVEADHAAFLRSAVTAAGGQPISKFTYNFDALPTTPLSTTDARGVLELLLQVEATGVRAYLGAVPLFSSQSAYLQAAAAIQATEARHTTTLTIARNLLYNTGTSVAPLSGDNRPGGTLPADAFSYEKYVPTGYNTAKPDEGVLGIDANLKPNSVLAAVSPFFVAPVA